MSEMTAAVPAIAVRCSTGVLLLDGPESYAERSAPRDNSKACRSILFSPKGQYLAWSNGTTIEVVRCSDWSQVCSISRPKSVELQFSPQGSYLVSWELYASNKDTPEGTANMYVYKVEDGSLVQSFIQKRQIGWQPCWSSDEKLLGRLVNTDIVVYDEAPFTQASARLNCAKVASFSMSPTPAQRCYIACHMPSVSNGPLFGKLFQYPKFEMTQAVASKAFFQGDAIHYHWNSTGTCVLLMTSTEVDKTGATYYGRQTLSFASTRGDTSLVQLSKEGPIYDVAWSPKGTEFCVVYGMMPSKATLFDIKCNPIFEFGTVARNSVFFSPNGSRLLLAGFGNLPGRVEVWDTESRRQLAAADAPDTTGITWDPRSECFLTYTCAPRLRTDNGFKVWHSSGSLMHEVRWPAGQELRELCWQPGSFPASGLATKKPKAVAPFKAAASGKPYRRRRASRATNSQLEVLVAKLEAQPMLATGRFTQLMGRVNYETGWKELSEELNAVFDGAVKSDHQQWITVWRDFKSRIRTKAVKLREPRLQTAHQEGFLAPLTELEERVIALIRLNCPESMPEEDVVPSDVESADITIEFIDPLQNLNSPNSEGEKLNAHSSEAEQSNSFTYEEEKFSSLMHETEKLYAHSSKAEKSNSFIYEAEKLNSHIPEAKKSNSPICKAEKPTSPCSEAEKSNCPCSEGGKSNCPCSEGGKSNCPCSEGGKPDDVRSEREKSDSHNNYEEEAFPSTMTEYLAIAKLNAEAMKITAEALLTFAKSHAELVKLGIKAFLLMAQGSHNLSDELKEYSNKE